MSDSFSVRNTELLQTHLSLEEALSFQVLDVLEYTFKAAAHYGDIRANLEKQGKSIGVNDLHIAGHARSEGSILVTNNIKEFERVEALRFENWV